MGLYTLAASRVSLIRAGSSRVNVERRVQSLEPTRVTAEMQTIIKGGIDVPTLASSSLHINRASIKARETTNCNHSQLSLFLDSCK
jgi:hypothetical protein